MKISKWERNAVNLQIHPPEAVVFLDGNILEGHGPWARRKKRGPRGFAPEKYFGPSLFFLRKRPFCEQRVVLYI